MKVTMCFIAPEKLKRLDEIQLAKYEFENPDKSGQVKKNPK